MDDDGGGDGKKEERRKWVGRCRDRQIGGQMKGFTNAGWLAEWWVDRWMNGRTDIVGWLPIPCGAHTDPISSRPQSLQ